MEQSIIYALLFGAGVYLIVMAFGWSQSTDRVRAVFQKKEDGTTAESKIFQAMLADIGQRLSPEKGDLNALLVKSGNVYASPVEYYTRRMYSAMVYFLAVLVVAFFFKMNVTTAMVLMTVGAVIGFNGPKGGLNRAIERRRDKLMKEMGFGLERIAVALASGAEMAEALMSARKVGLFGQASEHLGNQIAMQRPVREVTEEVKAQLPDTPEFNEFLEMVRIGLAKGTDIVPVFRTIADTMRQRLRLEVARAGEKANNTIAMITSGLTIFAVFAVILGPMFVAIAKFF